MPAIDMEYVSGSSSEEVDEDGTNETRTILAHTQATGRSEKVSLVYSTWDLL